MERAARPVLKWAGGKRRSLPRILALLPERIDTYFEPFIGGGAVFFSLAAEGRFRRAVIGDLNAELVGVYRAIKKDAERVIRRLEEMQGGNNPDEYYRIRAQDPETLDPFERAARVIYLNKTGYNGLYRVNRSGRFNVPFGRHKNPNICDADNLRAASRVLAKARIELGDFEKVASKATERDAVYFDPPYVPASKTASFTAYHSEAFDAAAQERLARVFGELGQRGVFSVLSNSYTPDTRQLYDRWKSERIAVPRPINSKSSLRGDVAEILVVNERRTTRRRRASRERSR
jgi:DNA adenine methylase